MSSSTVASSRRATVASATNSADRRDAADAGSILRVHLHVPFLELYAEALDVEARRHRSAAGRDEHVIDAQLLRPAVGELRFHVDPVGARSRAGHLRAGLRCNA